MYFRIRSTLRGVEERKQELQIMHEARLLFFIEGWEVAPGRSSYADTVHLGKESLYLHPLSFSGVIADKTIPYVLETLNGASSFECYHYDQYDEYFDMNDEQYDVYLKSKQNEIRDAFMEKLKTKRSNLYCCSWDIISLVSRKFRLMRIGKEDAYADREHEFSSDILDKLVIEGLIKSAKVKNGMGFRTANAKELAALKKRGELNEAG